MAPAGEFQHYLRSDERSGRRVCLDYFYLPPRTGENDDWDT